MIYFISGHRDITEEEFKKYYVPAIYSAYYNDSDFENFVVGDYEGVDKNGYGFHNRKPSLWSSYISYV